VLADEGKAVSERVCVIGAGRSGAVTAACLADLGHSVCAVDVDAARVQRLREGRAPFYEPGLDDTIQRNLQAGRLSFTTAMSEGVPAAHCVLVCVDTPPGSDGEADLTSLRAAIQELAPLLSENAVVVTRSTVPVGTNASVRARSGPLRPWPVCTPGWTGPSSSPTWRRQR
jgi:UDPglucose 6-dehydrogenase